MLNNENNQIQMPADQATQEDTNTAMFNVATPEQNISLPLPETPEIHYFHGTVGGHYHADTFLESAALIGIGVFSLLVVIILIV